MKNNGPILIIHNPNAGQRRENLFDDILSGLDKCGVIYKVIETEYAGHGEKIAREMTARDDFQAIIAAGGDGTINEVLNGTREYAKPIGIIPLGTANVFAKELGMEINVKSIVQILAGGYCTDVYVASINDQIFSLMASVGYDAFSVKNVNVNLKKKIGGVAYVISFIRALLVTPSIEYKIEINGHMHDAYGAIITNGKYYGGKYICAPDASVKENTLYAILFKNSGAFQGIKYFWSIMTNKISKTSGVKFFPVTKVKISSNHDAPIQIDGDYFGELPVTIKMIDKPVSIICPQE